jgi:murein DD-endopeptidase MepM/ murein hydrolase activator NlpD
MNSVREHFRIWSLYWIFGAIVVVALGVAVWTVAKVAREAWAAKAVESTMAIKPAAGAIETATVTAKKRTSELILPFATVPELGLTLYLYAPYKNIRGIGYHESSHNRAYSLTPVGRCLANDNAWDLNVSLDSQAQLPTYYIMESRGEYAYGTTVADIAMDPDTPVKAPISGTVLKIETKVIYDEYEDLQIEVVPDGLPNVRVAFLHIDKIKVKAGDKLKQGKTVMGIPRDWRPYFASELDDYVKPPMPHVHVQVNTPEPGQ